MSIHLPAALAGDPKAAGQECRRLLAELMEQSPRTEQFREPVQWFCDAEAAPVYAGQFPACAVVYEAADQPLDNALLASADVVFTADAETQALAVAKYADSILVPDGVEVRHFARTGSKRIAVPNDINFVPRPVLGYFGAVDERLDYGLILALAEADPDWSIVMVGPVSGVSPESLPRRNNIFWIGWRPYGEMPDYAFGFNVAIAPYAVNERTQRHSPVKLGEYVLSGRPVVCTDLSEARARFGEYITLAASPEEFITGCRAALDQPDREKLERGRREMAKLRWKHPAAKMERRVEEALARREA